MNTAAPFFPSATPLPAPAVAGLASGRSPVPMYVAPDAPRLFRTLSGSFVEQALQYLLDAEGRWVRGSELAEAAGINSRRLSDRLITAIRAGAIESRSVPGVFPRATEYRLLPGRWAGRKGRSAPIRPVEGGPLWRAIVALQRYPRGAWVPAVTLCAEAGFANPTALGGSLERAVQFGMIATRRGQRAPGSRGRTPNDYKLVAEVDLRLAIPRDTAAEQVDQRIVRAEKASRLDTPRAVRSIFDLAGAMA